MPIGFDVNKVNVEFWYVYLSHDRTCYKIDYLLIQSFFYYVPDYPKIFWCHMLTLPSQTFLEKLLTTVTIMIIYNQP